MTIMQEERVGSEEQGQPGQYEHHSSVGGIGPAQYKYNY